MAIAPLGMDETLWKKRNEIEQKIYGKHSSWRKGVEAGKNGGPKENPYTLPDDVWKLLRQRTYWEIGWEWGAYRKPKHVRKREKEEQLAHIKKEFKKKHKKHKHKKHGKHKHR